MDGLRKIQGSNYEDTFSLVVQPLSIRLVLTIVVYMDWSIHQIDISNAFLHGQLKERITVSQPYRFQDPTKPKHVCLLKKALYSLKQSALCWFKRLREVLFSFGFSKSRVDPSLFVSIVDSTKIFICVYVDDMIITRSNEGKIKEIISRVSEVFPIKDLGELKFFLGIQVKRGSYDLHLSQT